MQRLGVQAGLVPLMALLATASGAQDSAAEGALDADGLPTRSVSMRSLEVADDQFDDGLPFYVISGEDTQLLLRAGTPLLRVAAQTAQAVGYIVAPFDADEIDLSSDDPTAQPLIHGALRVPIHTLQTGSAAGDRLVQGLLAGSGASEVGFLLAEVRQATAIEPTEVAGAPVPRFRLDLSGDIVLGERKAPIDLEVVATFLGQTDATFGRYVGQLISLETEFEISFDALGIERSPGLRAQVGDRVSAEVFLMLSSVSPDRPAVPLTPVEQHVSEAQITTLLRDLGDANAAYRQIDDYLESIWADASALNRVAFLILAEKGIEDRRPAIALRAAQRAVELTERGDGSMLNSLARAQFESGDARSAVTTQQEAIAALEKAGGRAARALPRLQSNLERYRSGLPGSNK